MTKLAIVIPCYKVKKHILNVLEQIGNKVNYVYVVDDKCPESSGQYVLENKKDDKVKVLFNEENLGVGGAVKAGYKQALIDGADIIIKVDGDGQMDLNNLQNIISPIINGSADYTKGNRFYNIDDVKKMPKIRIFGNACLSFLTKLSSGYWNIFDPTNGYTAIHKDALKLLPLNKISNRYFFESDMLFRLNTYGAVVQDVPMKAIYEDEVSNLNILKTIPEFLKKNIINFSKRVFYNYFLRDFSLSSMQLLISVLLLFFGCLYGGIHWLDSYFTGVPSPTGTVVIPAMCIILGVQLLLSFFNYDIEKTPKNSIQGKS